MTIPSGLFKPGGEAGIVKVPESPVVPIEWIKSHPGTRRWWAKVVRAGVAAPVLVDSALVLADGYEGYIEWMMLLGAADTQGANGGIGWQLQIDRVAYLQTLWNFNSVFDTGGRIDSLMAFDGAGRSWGQIGVWVPEGSTVAVGMNNNGGTTDPIGWSMYGYYWPIVLRDQWLTQGWRGKA